MVHLDLTYHGDRNKSNFRFNNINQLLDGKSLSVHERTNRGDTLFPIICAGVSVCPVFKAWPARLPQRPNFVRSWTGPYIIFCKIVGYFPKSKQTSNPSQRPCVALPSSISSKFILMIAWFSFRRTLKIAIGQFAGSGGFPPSRILTSRPPNTKNPDSSSWAVTIIGTKSYA